ncbi:MAG: DUF2997 domain-containing protein [Candidatus Brocadiaceae bacterium]|nr:DUF2997 domain-containing protein [Candidatus Brocadiaceae bacterium]
MDQQKKIVLTFDKNTGKARVEAVGFQGESCAKATEFLRETLGKCTDFQRKAEWFSTNLELGGSINSNLCG